ncbi:M61 family metallopeptidase [Cyclobacterium xiamenense]|uniref:M61 family metallopeptidase n=1 Tax=Cyclobacterium xiamenense TaxID=1297121 RepID=UPI0012B9C7DA|nr:M61 family peptidase [Cyclobacterium xiamenense]
MKYTLSVPIPTSQVVEICLEIYCDTRELLSLQLPSWRPGRYEIANYAQYLKNLVVIGPDGAIATEKLTKDRWAFTSTSSGTYCVRYAFHAAQLDAGGSWVSPDTFYINFINLAFSVSGREDEPIDLQVILPETYRIGCALQQVGGQLFQAGNYQELVDSPLLASAQLEHRSYRLGGSTFHLWVEGKVCFDWDEVLDHFERFTHKQVEDFGEFPASDYHFLLLLLPFPHYHGVEHRFSTVITLGPDSLLGSSTGMDRLMGICSHELYHFWNVCRIRPRAIAPYDFSREAYLTEGLVAEGVTTYMGDFYLLKSGYYSPQTYLSKLETLFDRGFETLGWENQSIAASSFDLWLDGYKAGVPDKKVSIYTHGALLSLALDLMLLIKGTGLHQAMKIMWTKYGKPEVGYGLEDYLDVLCELSENPGQMEEFFKEYVWGTGNLFPLLESLLPTIGITVRPVKKENRLESEFGLKTASDGKIIRIHPKSPAFHQLMLQDLILSYKFTDSGLRLSLRRWGEKKEVVLPQSGQAYFVSYRIQITESSELFETFVRR